MLTEFTQEDGEAIYINYEKVESVRDIETPAEEKLTQIRLDCGESEVVKEAVQAVYLKFCHAEMLVKNQAQGGSLTTTGPLKIGS